MFRRVAAIVLALSLQCVLSQDMRESCVGCGDRLRYCEINCMHPTFRPDSELAWPFVTPRNEEDTMNCLQGCTNEYNECEETPEEAACLDCVQECATDYNDDILNCLQGMAHPAARSTFDDSMDDCANAVSSKFDACAEVCYGADAYYGWSPAKEEGETDESKFIEVPHFSTVASAPLPNLQETPKTQHTTQSTPSHFSILGASGIVAVVALVAGVIVKNA